MKIPATFNCQMSLGVGAASFTAVDMRVQYLSALGSQFEVLRGHLWSNRLTESTKLITEINGLLETLLCSEVLSNNEREALQEWHEEYGSFETRHASHRLLGTAAYIQFQSLSIRFEKIFKQERADRFEASTRPQETPVNPHRTVASVWGQSESVHTVDLRGQELKNALTVIVSVRELIRRKVGPHIVFQVDIGDFVMEQLFLPALRRFISSDLDIQAWNGTIHFHSTMTHQQFTIHVIDLMKQTEPA